MSDLNKDIAPNRGVELILSGGKTKKPKLFHIIFEKLIIILKRESSQSILSFLFSQGK